MRRRFRMRFSWIYTKGRYFRGMRSETGKELLNTEYAFLREYNSARHFIFPHTYSKSVREAFIDGDIGWCHPYKYF